MNNNLHQKFFTNFILVVLIVFLCSPAFSQITTPEGFLGHKAGADFKLVNYEQALEYYELLASQTDRMIILDMGPTSADRRMKYAVISSEANMANLSRYKDITKRLSLARGVSGTEAEQLAVEGKAIIWIDGGLHATEVAPAQHLIQLAYDLVSGEDKQTRLIRDNVITLLVFANPDGMTIVSDWYYKNLGTPYEVSRTPMLYHKYAGHDNNRDSHVANLIETQNISRAVHHEWFPHILFNQHQTAPFPARIWIPPESEPTNPNLHPIIVRWKNLIGAAMGKAFEEAGQDGAISRINFDSWYPGYVTQIVDSHNIPSILTETALYRYATPHYYSLNDFPESQRDLVVGTFYPTPWKGGWWRLGDAVAYNITASKSVLEVAAKYRYEFLINKYRIATDVMKKFESEPPYGWIIPKDQVSPNTAALLLNRMMLLGTEVYTADEDFTHNGISIPAGSHIIPTSQPFGYFVKNVLDKQDYPNLEKQSHLWQGVVSMVTWSGAPLRPYDGVGWTLPVQFGVDYQEMTSTLDVPKTLVTDEVTVPGMVAGNGSFYAFSPSDNSSFKALNQILAKGGKVYRANGAVNVSGHSLGIGAFLVEARSIRTGDLQNIASETGTTMYGNNYRGETTELKPLRLALYQSWSASMDMGWITYIFDQFDFPYHLLTDAEVKAGKLKDRFDVILFPDQRAQSIIEGNRKGTVPPDYAGGMTLDGVDNIREFIENGGVLVCNNSSSDLPVKQFKLPIKNVVETVRADSFMIPGSLLKVEYDTEHAVAYGMPENGILYFSRGRAYEIVDDDDDKKEDEEDEDVDKEELFDEENFKIIAKYPDGKLLTSGWTHGEDRLNGKAAAIEVPFGSGKIILFGFNFHNRAQARATFKLMFNALYYR
ncbi:M14 family metallopeptidase [candidate division KSB1 bacterium]